jgi:predicted nucleic-acid-binding Zn-ribbon protein
MAKVEKTESHGSKVVKCSCESKQQDEIHGPGRRVANKCNADKRKSMKIYRCTSCGREIAT